MHRERLTDYFDNTTADNGLADKDFQGMNNQKLVPIIHQSLPKESDAGFNAGIFIF